MTRRPSETRFALVFFTMALCASAYGIVEMQSIYHQSFTIYVSKLSETPSRYFVLENPDAYVLRAISTQDYVKIGSPEDTQIDDLMRAKETSYLEYNGTYYVAGYLFENKSPPAIPFLLISVGAGVSASSIVIVACVRTATQIRNEKRKPT